MPNKPADPKSKRLRRRDPRRAGPNRRASDHIMLASRNNGDKVQGPPISESVLAATRDVGATWLDLFSSIGRSIAAPARPAGDPGGGTAGGPSGGGMPPPSVPGRTVRRSGRSGAATTLSSFTPADASLPGVPPHIMVKGANVTSVALDLRPSSSRFVPHVRHLVAVDPNHALSAKFSASSDPLRLVLTIEVPPGQPAGTYTGAVVDSSTNEPGGTISVTVAG